MGSTHTIDGRGGEAPRGLYGRWKIPILSGPHNGDVVENRHPYGRPPETRTIVIHDKANEYFDPQNFNETSAFLSTFHVYRLVRAEWSMSNGESVYWGYVSLDATEDEARSLVIDWVRGCFARWTRTERENSLPVLSEAMYPPAKGEEVQR